MKGIVLAGGLGSRLYPLTKVTNKHLLPVVDKPMIYYPIQCLVNAGIRDIMIVTGGNDAGDFLQLLGNGTEFGFSGSAAGARLKETPLMLRQNQRFLGSPKGWIPPLGLLK